MEILTKEVFIEQKEDMLTQIRHGAVFVFPTDTIYAVGCNAEANAAVQRIRKIKLADHPFTVMAPSKEWMMKNLECNHTYKEYMAKLPGPVTLICKMKNKECVSESIYPGGDTLGVRLPNHWISMIAKELDKPIVVTSVNRAGQTPITKIQDISQNSQNMIDFAIDEGPINITPSTIIDLTKDPPEVRERK